MVEDVQIHHNQGTLVHVLWDTMVPIVNGSMRVRETTARIMLCASMFLITNMNVCVLSYIMGHTVNISTVVH